MSEFRASNCSQTRDEVALGPEMPATGKKGGIWASTAGRGTADPRRTCPQVLGCIWSYHGGNQCE